MTGKIPQRIGSKHPNIAPYGEFFTTKDDATITFAIGSNSQFEKLIQFLNLSELAQKDDFSTNQNRVINRDKLALFLQDKIKDITSQTILDWSLENHVPCGKIKSLDEVFEEAQAQKLIREETIDGLETKRVTSVAFKTRIPFGYKYQGPLVNRKRNSPTEHEHNNNH
jgi:crotonobetainyl-CoA:carnitine CoA-transferase CaiB-like acyl-CoA transferase